MLADRFTAGYSSTGGGTKGKGIADGIQLGQVQSAAFYEINLGQNINEWQGPEN